MNKKKFRIKFFLIGIIVCSFFVYIASAFAAKAISGCAKHEMVTRKTKITTCPKDASSLARVKEGYLYDGSTRVLDTLSRGEKKRFEIDGDSKSVIVIYRSPYTGEASFGSGQDKFNNDLEKNYVTMTYACGDFLSSKAINKNCKALGFTPEAREKQMQQYIQVYITEREESLHRSINDSRPIFFKQFKDMGIDDERIESDWQKYKEGIYEEYNFDPRLGKITKIITEPSKGKEKLEYNYDPRTKSYKQRVDY